MSDPELVKMSVFADRAGVPIPTIKHYLRERLLPEPVRTSRNMAYYDASLVPRVQAIKRLQSEMYLPLRVIRQVLDRLDDGVLPPDVAMEATIARVLGEQAPRESQSRGQLMRTGVQVEELSFLKDLGLLDPEGDGDEEIYRGDDVALLRVLGQARRAGITESMVPAAALKNYVEALANLVRAEVELFRAGIAPEAATKDLTKLTEAATTLSERLVVILRRKLLLPVLRESAH
ncbi:MAG: MerR family transcriptional regulator [Myxococcota bacterium]